MRLLVRKIDAVAEAARRGNIVFTCGGRSRDLGAASLVLVNE
jgi:hypothetical protein